MAQYGMTNIACKGTLVFCQVDSSLACHSISSCYFAMLRGLIFLM
jgi:hypothetical protein